MKKCIKILLIAFTLIFIFSNSMPDIEKSREESMGIMNLIEPILELFVGKGNVTLHLVRKLAHFVEFGLLGFLLGLFIKKPKSTTFLFALLTAMTDETIQIFTGRGSQVQDVWLDFAGACTGIFSGIVLIFIIGKLKNKSKENQNE